LTSGSETGGKITSAETPADETDTAAASEKTNYETSPTSASAISVTSDLLTSDVPASTETTNQPQPTGKDCNVF